MPSSVQRPTKPFTGQLLEQVAPNLFRNTPSARLGFHPLPTEILGAEIALPIVSGNDRHSDGLKLPVSVGPGERR